MHVRCPQCGKRFRAGQRGVRKEDPARAERELNEMGLVRKLVQQEMGWKVDSTRTLASVAGRDVMVQVLRRLGYSYPAIGRFVGRDHSTLCCKVAVKRVQARKAVEPLISRIVAMAVIGPESGSEGPGGAGAMVCTTRDISEAV